MFMVGSHPMPQLCGSAQPGALPSGRVCGALEPWVPWQCPGPGPTPEAPGVKALASLQLLGHRRPWEPGCWDAQAGSAGCQFPSHAACSGLCLGLSRRCGAGCAARAVTGIEQSPPAMGAAEDWSRTTRDHRLGGQRGQLCCLAKNCPNLALDPHRGLRGTETHHGASAAAESAITCFWPSSR